MTYLTGSIRKDLHVLTSRGNGATEVTYNLSDYSDVYDEDVVVHKGGGEVLSVKIPDAGPKTITLTLHDGRSFNVGTHDEALAALQQVYEGNRRELQSILIKEKVFVMTLDYLKKFDPAVQALYESVHELANHGASLTDADRDRGAAAIALATDLEKLADEFFTKSINKVPSKDVVDTFKTEFTLLAYSEEELLGRHQAVWKPILANILLALTSIGLLFIALRAIVYLIEINDIKNTSINNMFFFGKTGLQERASNSVELVENLPEPECLGM